MNKLEQNKKKQFWFYKPQPQFVKLTDFFNGKQKHCKGE